jgi:Na+-transporting methylmalonyl-CoA/oxaloacetate decarboxylase gamma subunit
MSSPSASSPQRPSGVTILVVVVVLMLLSSLVYTVHSMSHALYYVAAEVSIAAQKHGEAADAAKAYLATLPSFAVPNSVTGR